MKESLLLGLSKAISYVSTKTTQSLINNINIYNKITIAIYATFLTSEIANVPYSCDETDMNNIRN